VIAGAILVATSTRRARNPFAWDDAAVVVTGASSGLGRAIALAAAERGARVGLIARSHDALRATLEAAGGRGAVAACDLADAESTTAAIDALRAALGPVDLLVCAAGVGAFGPFADIDPAAIDALVATNVLGTLHPVAAVVPDMVARGRGRIVLIGSIAGRIGVPQESTYATTKAAVAGLGRSLAAELAGHGVVVTTVHPGPVDTPFFATRGHPYARRWPRPLPPDRVARSVLRAVERGRTDVVLPRWLRAAVVVDSLWPSLYRRGAARSAASDGPSSP
jgi:short-subunit dehydrogenase